MYNQIELISE